MSDDVGALTLFLPCSHFENGIIKGWRSKFAQNSENKVGHNPLSVL